MMLPQYDSNRSEPMPATSPTLSPTLSAMVPGFWGLSSGMPASTLPTRSAPTSAALVKMPPPTRANSAMLEAPIAKPWSGCASLKIISRMVRPMMPAPTHERPMTAPLLKAMRRPVLIGLSPPPSGEQA